MELLIQVVGILVVFLMGWVCWESSLMIEEKKERQRKGLTYYYDHPIKKD